MNPGEEWYEAYARERVGELPGTDPQAFSLAYNLMHLSQVLVGDFEGGVHRPRGWTLPGFRLMFKLWLLGPSRPARLAELSAMTRSAVSNLVNTLERDGLVERDRPDGDRRGVLVSLTDKGRAAVAEAFELQNERERSWFAVLDPAERDQLITLVRRLIAAR